ncbi:sodium/proton antiporter, partial [Pseudomonas sp. HMWF031]
MSGSMPQAFARNFLGNSPRWYKVCIVGFLILNALVLWTAGPVAAGWLLVLEFIFTLAMALKCYPLMPGGLLLV